MDRRPMIYTASKLCHASMWKELRGKWPEVFFTARWPDLVGRVPDDGRNAQIFWLHDIADIRKADAVLLYAETGEHLRGALVEAGAALGLGKQVICVGDHPDYGTWRKHPLVTSCDDLAAARLEISGWWNFPTPEPGPMANEVTRAQGRFLRRLADDTSGSPVVTEVVGFASAMAKRLADAGLIDLYFRGFGQWAYRLTPTGRAALDRLEDGK